MDVVPKANRVSERRGHVKRSRRGVLLLVVLSMLVLFMLIGTAFLMTSSQERESAKANAKKDRLGNYATKLLDRALLTVVRDTDDPNSVLRYQSLLRDLYGTDGFQAVVYSNQNLPFDPALPAQQVTRFAGALPDDTGTPQREDLGPTQGQLVDIYVGALEFNAIDSMDLRHVLKLDRNGIGQPQLHTLPLTKGYYNGCLLTITSGPAGGQSTRILDYEFVGQFNTTTSPIRLVRLFRFRVMAFPRGDGQPLQIDQSAARSPEIIDLAGATLLVNGRAFSGTGVGYNPLAAVGGPRLNALQVVPLLDGSGFVGEEIALTPNSRYLFAGTPAVVGQEVVGALPPAAGDPYSTTHPLRTDFAFLNTTTATNYGWFPGPGGANEPYDAADFQNIYLALQTVTPRAQGRVVNSDAPLESLDVTDPRVFDSGNNTFVNVDKFLRLDLEDLPLPSFFRPDLMNFWYHRLLNSEWLSSSSAIPDPDNRAKAILQPYDADGKLSPWVPSPQIAAQITALKRKISLRPLREDHPHFDGSNPLSRVFLDPKQKQVVFNGQIAIPYWEAVGPWDVDNDNDGVADSVWVDLGDPIQEAEDGTRYKPLYALLIIDLDGRLNVNAHGLVDHINPPLIGLVEAPVGSQKYVALPGAVASGIVRELGPPGTPQPITSFAAGPNLAGSSNAVTYSSQMLASGSGYGPAEISLRPVFSAPWLKVSGTQFVEGNRTEDTDGNGVLNGNDTPVDSYATLLAGRTKLGSEGVSGKLGYESPIVIRPERNVAPGLNYDTRLSSATVMYDQLPELSARMKYFNYPLNINFRTAYGTPPDMMGRYALGLDYAGQPVYELLSDRHSYFTRQARPLLVDSPYELDLSGRQRRDTWGVSFADQTQAFNQTLSQNDDASFATTDLERVLRAFDADAGTLPSRLWDVVDVFDPLKLRDFDPYHVRGVAQAVFGNQNPPEQLAAAQQIAAINRRLVTTDSFDLPVFSGRMPDYVSELGIDGTPGIFSTDDDPDGTGPLTNNGTIDDAAEIGAPGSDDFQALTGTRFSEAKLVDLLRYRIQSERIRNGILPFDLTIVAQKTAFELLVNLLSQQLIAPELMAGIRMDLNRPFGDGKDNAADGFDNDGDGFIDATDYNGNGRIDGPDANGNGIIDELEEAGDLMNKADGVVDDPLEAGDPFLDVNGNGKYDDGTLGPFEPFINLDGSTNAGGDPTYTPPRDQLWAGLGMAESVGFDYTNGVGVPLHPAVVAALGVTSTANVRNLESQARQLYARHLYCLMLLLMDENYIAPYDENDPQIKEYLDITINKSTAKNVREALGPIPDPNPSVNMFDQTARAILLRKLTCRMIAQWAINCVDMRDSDATMTPFEYDENPWDGWGCPDRNGLNIPLDGDPATNENGDESLTETQLPTQNMVSVIDWNSLKTGGPKATINTLVTGPRTSLNQTHGLVWGAERPELLITETLAFHDRRTEDLDTDFTTKDMLNEGTVGDVKDLDQRLRPRGGLFVELYSPWSPEGQYSAELCSKLFGNPGSTVPVSVQPSTGIELGRLSTLGVRTSAAGGLSNDIDPPSATPTVRRSPVWRMIVVEEDPKYRNDDTVDDTPNPYGTLVHNGGASKYRTTTSGSFFESVDPDRAPFDQQLVKANEPYAERSIYFTSGNSERYERNKSPVPIGSQDGNNSRFLLVKKPDDKLRLPPESPQSARYFVAANVADPTVTGGGIIPDVPLAPIMPGRYAVVGTAGAQYRGKETRPAQALDANGNPVLVPNVPRFVTTISRQPLGTVSDRHTDDTLHKNNLDTTRRIELLPSENPDVQQVLVAGNGGTPLYPVPGAGANEPVQRDNEIVKLPSGLGSPFPSAAKDRFRNIFDGDDDGNPDPILIPPCVAIPVMNMSASEPLDVYTKRRTDLQAKERDQDRNKQPGTTTRLVSHVWNPEAAEGEGAYVQGQNAGARVEGPYDEPFDVAAEFIRNGTTRNYRTVHLQRLADPTLPWNPLPTLPDGKSNPQHDPKLPVNLYRTIDTASVDMTAFNGASSREPADPNRTFVTDNGRWLPANTRNEFNKVFGGPGRFGSPGHPPHSLSFRSLERGWHATDTTTAGDLALVPRALWRQEPESRYDPNDFPPTVTGKNDMAYWYDELTTTAERTTELKRRINDLRIRDRDVIDKDIDAIANSPDPAVRDPDFSSFPQPDDTKVPLRPRKHQFDVVMKHSLGFQNEAFGALTTSADVQQQGLPTAAEGAPLKDAAFARSVPANATILATYPWLAWVNRPYISAEELLQVPAASSSQMLRQFSTINPNVPSPNPYDGRGVDTSVPPIPQTPSQRLAYQQSPFGHLLGAFQTSDTPATHVVDPATGAWFFLGAPHFYRILDYVHVPSRFVGTDDMLTAEIFNDVPGVPDTYGTDISGPLDPRYYFQPPFNKVSRERDPGKVNLNTVTGRRELLPSGKPRIWSEVFDGIMQRNRDGNNPSQLGHLGPAWRDVVLSRRGYAQIDANNTLVDKPPTSTNPNQYPDTFAFGLNPNFPTVFANPFRSPDAGDLVPLVSMVQTGVQVGRLRSHPYGPGVDGRWGVARQNPDIVGSDDDELRAFNDPLRMVDDAREAGFGDDVLIPSDQSFMPLFSERSDSAFVEGDRNPYFYYQPMTRLGNLVTDRSNVFAIWITVGYFEVEPAPNWNDPVPDTQAAVRARFGSDGDPASAATAAALALYNRVYPDGYMLGRELGSDTGDTRRPRGFYIVDRSEPVGFKPGEDLNVERMIRLRRRIE